MALTLESITLLLAEMQRNQRQERMIENEEMKCSIHEPIKKDVIEPLQAVESDSFEPIEAIEIDVIEPIQANTTDVIEQIQIRRSLPKNNILEV